MPVPFPFLMSGEAAPFRLAGACPVTDGPHYGDGEQGRFLVADVTVRDGAASVRIAAWRCRSCGVLLVGVGPAGVPLDGKNGDVFAQEFTWLEETVTLLDPGGTGGRKAGNPPVLPVRTSKQKE